MGNPLQDATDPMTPTELVYAMTPTELVYAMTPTELVKSYNTLNITRQGELLASLDELCEEWRTERRKAKRTFARATA